MFNERFLLQLSQTILASGQQLSGSLARAACANVGNF
jgi:hypothetical protein